MLPSSDVAAVNAVADLQGFLEQMKCASQLQPGCQHQLSLPVSLYALLELDRGLRLFEDKLNAVLCPLLSTPQRQVGGKEAVEWCAQMINEPKDKTIKGQLNLTDQQREQAAKKAGTHGSFVAAALELGYTDLATVQQLKTKLGEGCNHELKKKWPAYRNWDYKAIEKEIKAVQPARNALNHNQPLDLKNVTDTLLGMSLVLDQLGIDASTLKVSHDLSLCFL